MSGASRAAPPSQSDSGARARLERIFRAGVAAADPAAALARAVRRDGASLVVAGEAVPASARVFALALGKAAVPMARALAAIAGDRLAAGLAIAPAGQGDAVAGFRVREAAHPVPDARSARAGREALGFVSSVPREDVLLVLLSGGTSSLTTCPAPGLSLADLSETTRRLLACGAPIDELNAVRRRLSAVAGGRLAAACGAARIDVLVISDVAGDRFDVIGSGPFFADVRESSDLAATLSRRNLWDALPASVRAQLEGRAAGVAARPGVRHVLLASNRTALAGAREAARREGLRPVVLALELRGEAREVGARLAHLARGAVAPQARPACLLAGGETTVTVHGRGRGGRSQELALAAAIALEGDGGVVLLAAGTDGADGPTDAAGAFADGATLARARALGISAGAALADNDAHGFFAREGGLLRTGATGTNVRDLVLIETAAPAAASSRSRSAASG